MITVLKCEIVFLKHDFNVNYKIVKSCFADMIYEIVFSKHDFSVNFKIVKSCFEDTISM